MVHPFFSFFLCIIFLFYCKSKKLNKASKKCRHSASCFYYCYSSCANESENPRLTGCGKYKIVSELLEKLQLSNMGRLGQ